LLPSPLLCFARFLRCRPYARTKAGVLVIVCLNALCVCVLAYGFASQNGLVDMDMVLRLCMEEWAAEAYKRGRNLAGLFYIGGACQ
jgi:hypothetical protein